MDEQDFPIQPIGPASGISQPITFEIWNESYPEALALSFTAENDNTFVPLASSLNTGDRADFELYQVHSAGQAINATLRISPSEFFGVTATLGELNGNPTVDVTFSNIVVRVDIAHGVALITIDGEKP